MPPPLQVDLWPLDLESGVRVTCNTGYLCANFSLPRTLCSRLRPTVRDRQTDRQTYVRRASSFSAPTLGAGHNKSVAMRIGPRYVALSASRLSWRDHLCYVTSVKYLGVVPDASIFGCLTGHIK